LALIHCGFRSEVLKLHTSMDVILPETPLERAGQPPQPAPCLLLLHGLSDDHTTWQRRTSIERYVATLNLAVVMPCVHRSFYTDMAHGLRYWTFVSEEVLHVARNLFHLSPARADNFVAGLSMGGYGATKLALRRPDLFCAAASLSGVMDVASHSDKPDGPTWPDLKLVFGDRVQGGDDDLFALASRIAAQPGLAPRLYQCCGTEDGLLPDNTRFRDHARGLGLDLTYEEYPGSHNWGFWDQRIQRVLDWLPLKH